MIKKDNIFIIDGNGLIYRAYYAFVRNPLINSNNQNTSAIFGFFKLLLKLIKEYSAKYLSLVFDAKGKSFRNEIFKEYKANRQKIPEDLPLQIDAIKEILSIMNIFSIEIAGYEGDDIIGALSNKLKKLYDIYIVTGDKDVLQLVEDGIYVLQMKKGITEMKLVNNDNVKDVLGVLPSYIPDLFGLSGDAVDNIPGVKGIGEKTAKKLLSQFGSIENIYENISIITPNRIKNLLIKYKDNAFLSKKLATIKKDIDINIDRESIYFNKDYLIKAIPLLKELELESVIGDINSISTKNTQDTLFESHKPILTKNKKKTTYL